MRLGICTSDFKPQRMETLFKKIHDFGFTAVQLNFRSIEQEEMPSVISDEFINKIENETIINKIKITSINGTFNMAQSDYTKRDESIRRFSVIVDACGKLGCNIITLCTGTRSTDSMWKWHPDNATKAAWDEVIETTRIIAAIADKANISLGVETEASNVVDTPQKTRKMMDEVGFDNVKVILDCANLFLPGTAHVENVHSTIKNAFDLLGKEVILAHGKDIADTQGISFCATGQGIVDYDYFIESLKQYHYKGDIILHGIYDETKMSSCLEFMKQKLIKHKITIE